MSHFKTNYPSILFMDCNEFRHKKFYIKGNSSTRYVHKVEQFMNILKSDEHFDVMFLPSWYKSEGRPGFVQEVGRVLSERKNLPKLIVFTGHDWRNWTMPDELRILVPLQQKGVLLAHVPWQYDDPAVHTRIAVPSTL